MTIFLFSFLAMYGGMHAYAFYRIRTAYSVVPAVSVLLAAWMILMTTAPIIVRVLERSGKSEMAAYLAWPAYIWMGFVFLLSSSLLVMETACIVNWLSGKHYLFLETGFLTARGTCSIAISIAVIASFYAGFEAGNIQSEHVVIKTGKLPDAVSRIRIVQISDVHIGILLSEKRLERIISAIRRAEPDLLISTGDLVDGRLSREEQLPHQKRMAAMLAEIRAPEGKYAVTGNHEAYVGLRQALEFTREAGFTPLQGRSIKLPVGLTITGIDDPAVSRTSVGANAPEQSLLAGVSKDSFRLLLKHRPLIPQKSDGLFDLQLSGHVHKGQIFPFNLIVRLKHPILCGTTVTAAGSRIHVSRGTGTWGPPMRLLAPPEITVIDLISESHP